MTTVYIYIGTPKTGTTAIQSFLRENEEVLAKKGYGFPLLNLGIRKLYDNRNGHFLVNYSEKKDPVEKKKEEDAMKAEAYRQLEEAAKKYPNLILTDETIWHRCNIIPEFWPDLVENFRKINCEVRLIVYLRRQDLMIQSLWNQSIKMSPRHTVSFKEYLEAPKRRFFPLVYYRHLNKISRYIPKEHIIVRPFERGQFEGEEHSLYSDFLKAVGLTLTEEYQKQSISDNFGLDGNFIEIKRLVNTVAEYRELPGDPLCYPILNASIQKTKEGKIPKTSQFAYEDQIAFMKQFEEENRLVAEEYLGRKDGRLFLEPIRELPKWEISEKTMPEDLVLAMTRAFAKQQKDLLELREAVWELRATTTELRRELDRIKNNKVIRILKKSKLI